MKEKKVAVKCDSCGQFHLLEDCEEVIIKITKGRNCPLPSESIFSRNSPEKVVVVDDNKTADVIPSVVPASSFNSHKEDPHDVNVYSEDMISVEKRNEILRRNKGAFPVVMTGNGPKNVNDVMKPPID